jgi:GT2 family glycosyltransferase
MTSNTIESIINSQISSDYRFNIVVIESNKELSPFQFPNSITIYPTEEFGFNRFLNIGIANTQGEYICMANNDLEFSLGWAEELLKEFEADQNLLSANPFCKNFDYREEVRNGPNVMNNIEYPNTFGILTGWCIFVKRGIFDIIGKLDENFIFWYADNDYELTLKSHSIKHALVKSSHVLHLGSQSHQILNTKENDMTYGQRRVFEKKWIYRNRFHLFFDKLLKRFCYLRR